MKIKARWMMALVLAMAAWPAALGAAEGSGAEGSATVPGAGSAMEAAAKPSLVAVKVHADSCATCKKLGPVMEDLTQQLGADSQALLITMDLTNEATKRQSRLLMAALGLGDVYQNNSKTGVILLVNPETKKVVKTLTADLSRGQMVQAIHEAAPGSGKAQPAQKAPEGSGMMREGS